MNSLCTIILANFSSLPRTFCATHLYFPASSSCTPAIFITPLDNTFVRLLGNVSLIRDQTKVGAGFPDVEHSKTAASLSFTVSCEEETVNYLWSRNGFSRFAFHYSWNTRCTNIIFHSFFSFYSWWPHNSLFSTSARLSHHSFFTPPPSVAFITFRSISPRN